MALAEDYFGEHCPKCLTWAGDDVSVCPGCGYPIPLAGVIPPDDPPWDYSDALVATLKKYEALRLMAKFAGRSPERLAELRHCRRLYLSKYAGFGFAHMRDFDRLEYFELDFTPVRDLDGLAVLKALSILKLTELRQLERIEAVAECAALKLLSLALCNRITDYSAIGKLSSLQLLFIEAKALPSLDFLSGLKNLRFLTLAVGKIESRDLDPILSLDGIERLVIEKKLTKPADVKKIRERFPDAELRVE